MKCLFQFERGTTRRICRKFTVPLRAALRDAGVLANYETPKRPVVHVFFIAPGCCYTGYSYS
ncbi:hypothetical protein ACUOA8_17740, partial [Escherichia sp. SS-MK2]